MREQKLLDQQRMFDESLEKALSKTKTATTKKAKEPKSASPIKI